MTVDQIVTLLSWLVNAGIPLLVAFITKTDASALVRSLVNLGLSALSTAILTVIAGLSADQPLDWFTILFTLVTGYLVSASTYTHIWKPTGIAPTVAQFGRKGDHSLAS